MSTETQFEKIAKAAPDFDKESVDAFVGRVRAGFSIGIIVPIEEANKAESKLGRLRMSRKYREGDYQRVQTWCLWLKRIFGTFAIIENDYASKLFKVPFSDDGSEVKFDLDKAQEVKEDFVAKAGFHIELTPAIWSPVIFGTTDTPAKE